MFQSPPMEGTAPSGRAVCAAAGDGIPWEIWDNTGDSALGKCLDGDGGLWRGWLLPAALLCKFTHPGPHRAQKKGDLSLYNPVSLIAIFAPGAVILNFLLFCLFLSFYLLPAVPPCAWMAVESIQFQLVVISGKSFLTCRSSEFGDFVPCPFSEVRAFPSTLLCTQALLLKRQEGILFWSPDTLQCHKLFVQHI